MADTILVLGRYRFSIDTAAPSSVSRSDVWRHQSQDPVGNDPIYQFMGPGETTITLPGVIYPHYGAGLQQINTLRDEADLGEPMQFITGYGENLGKWVITAVQEDREKLLGAMPRKISFTISLTRVERP
jgi:phage protein U